MMKYFESFDIFSGDWERITRGKFHDTTINMKASKINEPERLRIEKIFQKHFNPKNVIKDWPKIEIWERHSTEYYFTSIKQDEIIFIFSYEDEWYYIEKYNQETFDSVYYKCDSIEGLEKCLQDNF